jgi:hypothetical protein
MSFSLLLIYSSTKLEKRAEAKRVEGRNGTNNVCTYEYTNKKMGKQTKIMNS